MRYVHHQTLLSYFIATFLFVSRNSWFSDASAIMLWSAPSASCQSNTNNNIRCRSLALHRPNSKAFFGRRGNSSSNNNHNHNKVYSRRRGGGYSDMNEIITVQRTTKAAAEISSNSGIRDEDRQLSYEEMRAELGPLGSFIANSVEIAIVTAGSYLSGAVFGYFIGGVMGAPSLMESSSTASTFADQLKHRIKNWNNKAFTQAKSWGKLSAAFSGFGAFTKIARGNSDDKWNSIIGSALTGAYLSRQGNFHKLLHISLLSNSFE